MKKSLTFLLTYLVIVFLFSCGSVTINNGRQKVIIKPHQPPCDFRSKEIDPNCKIEEKSLTPKKYY